MGDLVAVIEQATGIDVAVLEVGPDEHGLTMRPPKRNCERRASCFRAAATIWRKPAPRWIQILSDDQTPKLAAVVHRITRQPMEERSSADWYRSRSSLTG